MDQRLSEIEIKLAFTEDLLEELNRVVARQQRDIEALRQQLRELRRHMERGIPDTPPNEIPPHC